ncbi:AAA family ATPase [Candidatus Absconditicoccus praedator]|uniref:AAA family ATPase n=1 Tax=Candidatus Absconditicoccus praedator TaxID=2735562 RepID=UPI001E32A301|nr:ATP-binding protein [Candidatus Absconditicoccus praedator]UFX83522.1 ATP-binding protein [Candidatus Absconditicoccus praedator]
MLVDITIKNYLSFKEATTFSMLADGKTKDLPENVFQHGKHKLLKTSVIYGPNASGKSNLLQAIKFARDLIVYSHKYDPNLSIPNFQPYKLCKDTIGKPSEFEINFYVENTLYNYYFAVNQNEIVSEKLKAYKSQKPSTLFTRDRKGISIKNFDDNDSAKRVKENNLALSVFADENSEEAKKIHKFFTDIHIISAKLDNPDTQDVLLKEGENFKPFLLNLLKIADPTIKDYEYKINEKEVDFDSLPQNIKNQFVQAPKKVFQTELNDKIVRDLYDKNGNVVGEANFKRSEESEGTKRIYQWAGSLYNVMKHNKILFVDELEDSLHPMLVENMIRSLHQKTDTTFQLVFNTHNSYLLSLKDLFRKDQIWFTEKDKYGVSDLYSLLEFKTNQGIRKDTDIETNYLKGRFGAIPFIDEIFKS